MTATAQQVKPAAKVGTWASMFPNEQTTETQSLLFVKKLLAVAISNIAYLRAIFPECAFGDRCLEDINLKILKEDCSCLGASQVIKWIKGCFDALDKKFLRMMIIGIYVDPNEPETVIESYTFKFSYDENGGIDIYRNSKKMSGAHSSAETKKATIRLLHTIIVLTQSLKSLPDNVMMTMKLLYYDDVTPEDYEPPGFVASEQDCFVFDQEPTNIKVGDVATPFHMVKVRVKTDASFIENDGEDEAVEQAEETQSQSENTMQHETTEQIHQDSPNVQEVHTCGGDGDQMVPEPSEADPVPEDAPIPAPDEQAVDNLGSQLSNAPSVPEDNTVKCACGCNEDDGLMIICEVCKTWQHGVCYQIFEDNEAPARHICHICGDPKTIDRVPTDSTLHGQNELAVEATCLWRRTLHSCLSTKKISGHALAKTYKIDLPVANSLYRRLENEGYVQIPARGKRFGGVIDQEKLAQGIKKYFVLRNEKSSEKTDSEKVNPENVMEPTDKNSTMDVEIETITSKAEDLDVSGKWKGQKNDEVVESQPKGKGRKRSKSTVDELDLDMTESQEFSQPRNRKKRCKSSNVDKAIPV